MRWLFSPSLNRTGHKMRIFLANFFNQSGFFSFFTQTTTQSLTWDLTDPYQFQSVHRISVIVILSKFSERPITQTSWFQKTIPLFTSVWIASVINKPFESTLDSWSSIKCSIWIFDRACLWKCLGDICFIKLSTFAPRVYL